MAKALCSSCHLTPGTGRVTYGSLGKMKTPQERPICLSGTT